jgi:hypothetical protein
MRIKDLVKKQILKNKNIKFVEEITSLTDCNIVQSYCLDNINFIIKIEVKNA